MKVCICIHALNFMDSEGNPMICICKREKTVSYLFIIVRKQDFNVKVHEDDILISSEEIVLVKIVKHGSKGTNESYSPMI